MANEPRMPIACTASFPRLWWTISRVYLPGAGAVHPMQPAPRGTRSHRTQPPDATIEGT
jgi:hypothetical protein